VFVCTYLKNFKFDRYSSRIERKKRCHKNKNQARKAKTEAKQASSKTDHAPVVLVSRNSSAAPASLSS
jgi:hypothetical protein